MPHFLKQKLHSFSVLRLLATMAILLVSVLLPEIAFAEDAELALPYEEGLGKFQESLEGPVPFAISLVGIVGCGAMLIFGGEITGFMRTMIFIVLVVAVMVQAKNVVSMLGGTRSLSDTAYVIPDTPSLRYFS
ncbi:type IV secretory pathway VirB2 component (pilin) [Luteibacter sp. W1I16]|uniref:TrbC/VirB2 family protein n=1 Tax=Luteibacter sp. W1I16 TaxID=3373922 RepID=UPI003D24DA21